MVALAEALAGQGIEVVTFDFLYRALGRRRPDPPAILEQTWRDALASANERLGPARGSLFVGGRSMGGRIASQSAARGGLNPAPAGLVFFGYPLHPPGKAAQRRDKHLPDITVPMLFLHGTRDPFGSPDEMQALVASLPSATLEVIDGGDHSLMAARQKPAASPSLEKAIDIAAAWIKGQTAATNNQ